ncbi:MAG: hypothetical protein IJC74_04320 [Clostridia bacterium]|nr:hypothetical protein [Clostridia bacterium]
MKKFCVGIICLMLISVLMCLASTYTVTRNGIEYTVDTDSMTISDGTNTYQYIISGEGSEINITYPDGSTYWWKVSPGGGWGGWSDDYDPEKYVDGDVLISVLEEKTAKQPSSDKNFLLIFILIIIGLWNVISPYSSWYLSRGWHYKDAEPSEASLAFTRIGGVIVIIIAVIILFV